MTQTFVDRYMEDDMIYKIIGLARDNVVYIVAIFVTGLVTFFSGKLYGVKTHSVISALKERYENIEIQKKKLKKQIAFLGSTDKLIKKFIILTFLFQVGLIANIIIHRGFDYTVLLANSLSRNLILMLSAGLLILLIAQRGFRRYKTNKTQYLSTINSGMDDIADKLLKSLGPELTTILKMKLQTKFVNTKTSSTQTVREAKPKAEVVINPAEVNELKKQIAALENLNQTRVGAIELEEITKTILRKDLHRHKSFLQRLKEFEWCENCLQHAEQDEEEEIQEEEKIKEQPEENEEGGAPEKTHPVNPENKENKDEVEAAKNSEEQKKEEAGNNGDQKGGEKGECCNQCLKKYFQMGYEMSEQFNAEEREIFALRSKFGLARASTSVA